MIGNDVVDLAIAKKESNWKRKGFLNKIFTTTEQSLIQNAIDKHLMVWLLWSLKESTYKAYLRIHYHRGFYPIQIKIQTLVQVKKQYYATISLFGKDFKGKSTIQKNNIHSIVLCSNLNFVNVIENDNAKIIKDRNSLPLCEISNNFVSISHHGDFKKIIQLKL